MSKFEDSGSLWNFHCCILQMQIPILYSIIPNDNTFENSHNLCQTIIKILKDIIFKGQLFTENISLTDNFCKVIKHAELWALIDFF